MKPSSVICVHDYDSRWRCVLCGKQLEKRLIATILERDRERILNGGSIKGDQAPRGGNVQAAWKREVTA